MTQGTNEPKVITFEAADKESAAAAATRWINDFTLHGPIHFRGLSVSQSGGKFVATVQYAEAR